jgi:hypothetical protein
MLAYRWAALLASVCRDLVVFAVIHRRLGIVLLIAGVAALALVGGVLQAAVPYTIYTLF